MQFQSWAHHDDRSTRIVYAFTEQVLTESTLLAFDHIGKRLQRSFVGPSYGTTTTAVVKQGVDGFLQHSLLISNNNVRRVKIEKTLQTIVSVNYPPIQIVQIRGGKTATIERNQGAQIGGQHWQHGHHHPLRLVTGIQECFQQLQALGKLLQLGLRISSRNLFTQMHHFGFDVHIFHQGLHCFRTHFGLEFIAEFFHRFIILLIVKQLTLFQRGHTRIGDNEGLEIENPFDVA